jgi:CRP-like cAMP-binding protein
MGDILNEAQLMGIVKTMKKPAADRTLAELGFLMDIAAEVKFFQKLSFALMQKICRALRASQLKKGDDVFRQGDDGWDLYIILSGEVDVLVDGKVVTKLATGNYFGEQALIDGGGADSKKRSATIRCTDHCFFGLLSKTEYNNVLKKEHSAALKPVIDFYSSTMYCKLLQPDLNLKLAHVTQLRKWKKGDLVFQAGDVVDSMIFLLSGECLITKDVYLGAESALRGSAPASLTGSCHPGLRQDTKKITIDIATVCGHGDIVGETELLAEVIAEMKAASKEKREKEKQKVREKRQKAAQKADTADKLSSPKNSKAKARNKGPAEPEFDAPVWRKYNVIALTDIEAYTIRSRDARRYILRQEAAQQQLVERNRWRETLFDKRMAQWQHARQMQHEHVLRPPSPMRLPAPPESTLPVEAEPAPPLRTRRSRTAGGRGGGAGHGFSIGLRPSSPYRRDTRPQSVPLSLTMVDSDSLPSLGGSRPPSSAAALRMRAHRPAASPSQGHTRAPLHLPKHQVQRVPLHLQPLHQVAFMSSAVARPKSVEELALAERPEEAAPVTSFKSQWLLQWEKALAQNQDNKARHLRATLADAGMRESIPGGRSGMLGNWFEDVSYITSEGTLCG